MQDQGGNKNIDLELCSNNFANSTGMLAQKLNGDGLNKDNSDHDAAGTEASHEIGPGFESVVRDQPRGTAEGV